MGVDYSPILAVGKIFKSEIEAENFFCTKIELTEEQIEEIDCEGFVNFLQSYHEYFPTAGVFSVYTPDPYVWVGFEIDDSTIDKFIESTKYGLNSWRQLFGEEPKIINEVKIW